MHEEELGLSPVEGALGDLERGIADGVIQRRDAVQ